MSEADGIESSRTRDSKGASASFDLLPHPLITYACTPMHACTAKRRIRSKEMKVPVANKTSTRPHSKVGQHWACLFSHVLVSQTSDCFGRRLFGYNQLCHRREPWCKHSLNQFRWSQFEFSGNVKSMKGRRFQGFTLCKSNFFKRVAIALRTEEQKNAR